MEQFNILVCDDDKSIVDAIEIYLKQENYNVIKAYNGLEALQALEENEVHLILLDIMMPQMDGLQTTVKIRENLNIPIIILSAKSEDTDKILGLNFGADDYITKPFNPLELMARVKSHMRRYTALGSIAEKTVESLYANIFFFSPMQLGAREGGFALSASGLSIPSAFGVYTSLITRVRELIWIVIGVMLMKVGNGTPNKDKQ